MRFEIINRVVRFALSAGFVLSLATTACSKSEDNNPNNPPPTPSDEIASVEPLAQGTSFLAPMDAAPSPEGDAVAFSAMTAGGAAIFRVATAGGSPSMIVPGDAGLIAPHGIVWSTDGMRLYISDLGVDSDPAKGLGRIYGISAEGGTLESLSGAEGLVPRSLELVEENGSDVIYFTGMTADKKPAVFKMSASGSNVEEIVKGEPLSQPSGITVDKNGVIYVADGAGDFGGTLFKIDNGTISQVAGGMRFGSPAGIALVPSESAVLISGHHLTTGNSAVYKVELASGAVSSFDDGIGDNGDSGGLRRARKVSVFAWADSAGSTRGETQTNGGTVFLLKGK